MGLLSVLLLVALLSPLLAVDNTSEGDCAPIQQCLRDQGFSASASCVVKLQHDPKAAAFVGVVEKENENSALRQGAPPFDLKLKIRENEAFQQCKHLQKAITCACSYCCAR